LRASVRAAGPKPAGARAEAPRGGRHVTCFQCGTELAVPPSAQSTMCKRCSAHVDLRDYEFTATESKNYKTKGRGVLHEGACLLNTDSIFGHAIVKGKVIGKIAADELELHPTAVIKGSFKAGKLVLPAGTILRWPETVAVKSADIAGEFVGNFKASGTVTVRAGGRVFGNVEAGGLVVESSAVIVGSMKIGVKEAEPAVRIAEGPIEPVPKVARPAREKAMALPLG